MLLCSVLYEWRARNSKSVGEWWVRVCWFGVSVMTAPSVGCSLTLSYYILLVLRRLLCRMHTALHCGWLQASWLPYGTVRNDSGTFMQSHSSARRYSCVVWPPRNKRCRTVWYVTTTQSHLSPDLTTYIPPVSVLVLFYVIRYSMVFSMCITNIHLQCSEIKNITRTLYVQYHVYISFLLSEMVKCQCK